MTKTISVGWKVLLAIGALSASYVACTPESDRRTDIDQMQRPEEQQPEQPADQQRQEPGTMPTEAPSPMGMGR